ncbi:MAG TPA: hypothetical protein VMZ27_17490 [Candidatus Saccharimonadales bacterium]|nr:hypothetical protein [Candidatus Saccharimonadales bacterium]
MSDDQNVNPTPDGSSQRQPLEPREDESADAYEAFIYFADYGPKRTHAVVAKAFDISIDTIKKWSSKHCWLARVKAHKARFVQKRDNAETSALQQTSLAKAKQDVVRQVKEEAVSDLILDKLPGAIELKLHDPENLKVGEIKLLADISTKFRRPRTESGAELALAEIRQDASITAKWVYAQPKAVAPQNSEPQNPNPEIQ